MVVEKWEGRTSWKIGKEIMDRGRRISTWVCPLREMEIRLKFELER